MSGLSNWALNQRIYSVAARSKGGGSTNSTIGQILSNDETGANDAGNKAITNLSEIDSAQVTTPLVKSTEPIVLQSGDNTISIGTDGKLTLPNPLGEGILCKDSSNIVEKVTVGGNLAYDTSTKTLNTAADLTGLTSVGTGKLTLTDTDETNIEGAVLDDPTITLAEGPGIYSIDSAGKLKKIFLGSNLSFFSNTNTLSWNANSISASYAPRVLNYQSSLTDSTPYWNNASTAFYQLSGAIMNIKGYIRGSEKLLENYTDVKSFKFNAGRDETINENYVYVNHAIPTNPNSIFRQIVFYEHGATQDSTYNGYVVDQSNRILRPLILNNRDYETKQLFQSEQASGDHAYFEDSNIVMFQQGNGNPDDYTGEILHGAGNYDTDAATHILHPLDTIQFYIPSDNSVVTPGPNRLAAFSPDDTTIQIWEAYQTEATDYSGYMLHGGGLDFQNGYILEGLPIPVETDRDDTINSSYIYTRAHPVQTAYVQYYIFYEHGASYESNNTNIDNFGQKYNSTLPRQITSRDYSQDHFFINTEGNLEVFTKRLPDEGSNDLIERKNLIGNLVDNTGLLEALNAFPVYYYEDANLVKWNLDHDIYLIIQANGVYFWEPSKTAETARGDSFNDYIIYNTLEINPTLTLPRPALDYSFQLKYQNSQVRNDLGPGGYLSRYNVYTINTNTLNNRADLFLSFGRQLTDDAAINGSLIYLSKIVDANGYGTGSYIDEYKLSNYTVTVAEGQNIKLTPTRYTVTNNIGNYSTSIEGVYTTYESANDTTLMSDLPSISISLYKDTSTGYNGASGTLTSYVAKRLDEVSYSRENVRGQLTTETYSGNILTTTLKLTRPKLNGTTILGSYTRYHIPDTFYQNIQWGSTATDPAPTDLRFTQTRSSITNHQSLLLQAVVEGVYTTYNLISSTSGMAYVGGYPHFNSTLPFVVRNPIPPNVDGQRNICFTMPVKDEQTISLDSSNTTTRFQITMSSTDLISKNIAYLQQFIYVIIGGNQLNKNQYSFEKVGSTYYINFTTAPTSTVRLEKPYVLNHDGLYYSSVGTNNTQIITTYPTYGYVHPLSTTIHNCLQMVDVLDTGFFQPFYNYLPKRPTETFEDETINPALNFQRVFDYFFSRGDNIFFDFTVEIIP